MVFTVPTKVDPDGLARDEKLMGEARRYGRFDPARSMEAEANPFLMDPELEPMAAGLPAKPTWRHAGLVFLGGAIGTLLRYVVLLHVNSPTGAFPWAVFTINVSGSLLLGLLGGTLFARRPDLTGARIFLATGVLGGWTTYSSVIAGMLTLAHEQEWGTDAMVLVLSLIVPVLAAGLGLVLGDALSSKRAS